MLTVTNKVISVSNKDNDDLELEVNYNSNGTSVTFRTDGFTVPLDEHGRLSEVFIDQLNIVLGSK